MYTTPSLYAKQFFVRVFIAAEYFDDKAKTVINEDLELSSNGGGHIPCCTAPTQRNREKGEEQPVPSINFSVPRSEFENSNQKL